MADQQWVSLLGLSRAEQANAKRVFKHVRWAQASAGLLAAAALFVDQPLAFVFAVCVLAAQAAAWILRRRGMTLHRLAEEGRRRALLIASLGTSSERLDIADLRQRFSKRACQDGPQFENPDYWASTKPEGPGKLTEALQESAFFSKHLYGPAATRAFVSAISVLVAVIVLGGASMLLTEGETELAVARTVVAALAVLIGVDELGQGLSWRSAATAVHDVDRRLDRMHPDVLESLLAVFTDYTVATSSAPPIPDPVYEKRGASLEERWAERSGQ